MRERGKEEQRQSVRTILLRVSTIPYTHRLKQESSRIQDLPRPYWFPQGYKTWRRGEVQGQGMGISSGASFLKVMNSFLEASAALPSCLMGQSRVTRPLSVNQEWREQRASFLAQTPG